MSKSLTPGNRTQGLTKKKANQIYISSTKGVKIAREFFQCINGLYVLDVARDYVMLFLQNLN